MRLFFPKCRPKYSSISAGISGLWLWSTNESPDTGGKFVVGGQGCCCGIDEPLAPNNPKLAVEVGKAGNKFAYGGATELNKPRGNEDRLCGHERNISRGKWSAEFAKWNKPKCYDISWSNNCQKCALLTNWLEQKITCILPGNWDMLCGHQRNKWSAAFAKLSKVNCCEISFSNNCQKCAFLINWL